MKKKLSLKEKAALMEQALKDANAYFENCCSYRDSRESWLHHVDTVTEKIIKPALCGEPCKLSEDDLDEVRNGEPGDMVGDDDE